jgi:hypothetical protein
MPTGGHSLARSPPAGCSPRLDHLDQTGLVRESLCPDTGVSVSTNDRHLEHHQITRVTIRAAAVLTVNDVDILKFSARGQLVYRGAFGLTNVPNQQRRARYAASRSTRPHWLHKVISATRVG